MKDRLSNILKNNPLRQWVVAAKRDFEFIAWVNEQTLDMSVDTAFPERVWCATTGERPACKYGNVRTMHDIIRGFKFCAKTGQCKCAQESVSSNVTKTKAQDTPEKKAQTQADREATNLAKYGHRNTGQTVEARAAHTAFYTDQENIKTQVAKQVAVMQRLYGVDNPAHLSEIAVKKINTNLERHGVSNPMQVKAFAQQSLTVRMLQGYSDSYYRRNYDMMAQKLRTECNMNLVTPFEEYQGVAGYPTYDVQCPHCSHSRQWNTHYNRMPRCAHCNPAPASLPQKQIFEFIRDELGITDVINNDRRLIAPLEVDILSHQFKIAIEYCGLYYHGERQRTDKKYHLNKLNALHGKGYRLLTIFSDEWYHHEDIIKSILRYMFNLIGRKYFARKLAIREIEHHDVSAFYETSHLQGSVGALHHIGLYDGSQIVAAMSFQVARHSRGLSENSFELVRFSVLPNSIVVGAASRLFRYFVTQWQPQAIVSYADRRWSEGNLYCALGFKLEHTTPPDYSYVINEYKREFRFSFRKDVLKEVLGDFAETEWEMMQALDYDRIWDCGKHRFVWKSVTSC